MHQKLGEHVLFVKSPREKYQIFFQTQTMRGHLCPHLSRKKWSEVNLNLFLFKFRANACTIDYVEFSAISELPLASLSISRLGTCPLMWKWVFSSHTNHFDMKNIVVHPASFWWRGLGQLGNASCQWLGKLSFKHLKILWFQRGLHTLVVGVQFILRIVAWSITEIMILNNLVSLFWYIVQFYNVNCQRTMRTQRKKECHT